MHLGFVLYRSYATIDLNEDALVTLFNTCLRNNPREGITGFMHTEEGHFLQYLEGPINPLMRKLAQIRKDRRHRNFIILAEGDIEERLFPDFDMGQIRSLSHPDNEMMRMKHWMKPDPDVDPIPLIQAFAMQAGLENAVVEKD